MAIAPLVVSVVTAGAARLRNLGADLRRLANTVRTSWGRATAGFIQRGGLMGALNRLPAHIANLGRQLGTRIRGLAASAGRGLMAAGRNIVQGLGRGISNAMSNLPSWVTPQTVAAGAAIAAILGTALGAALNGAILAVVGGGVMAAGIVAAIKSNKAIGAAFKSVFSDIGRDVKQFSVVFDQPLINSARVFEATWSRVSTSVSRMFATMSQAVEPLARGLAGLVERALPGIEAAVQGAAPVFRELQRSLPALGSAVGQMFASFGRGSEGAARGLRYFILWLSGTLIAIGRFVEALSNGFRAVTDWLERFANALARLPIVGRLFQGFADDMARLNGSVQGSARAMEGAKTASDGAAGSFDRQAEAARKAGEAAAALSAKMSALIGGQLSAQEAAIQWEASLDALAASLQENGRNLDIGTEKGRANTQAVLAAVQAANAKREADIQLAGGEKASADAVARANATFAAQVEQLAATLRAAGATEDQINQLLGAYRAVANAPNIVKTIEVRTIYKGGVARIGASGGLSGSQLSGEYRGGGGRASGGPIRAGQPYIVGEQGAELIVPTRSGYVYNASETARMMAGSPTGARSWNGGGGARTLVYDGPRGGLDTLFASWFETMVRKGRIRLAA